MSYTLYLYPCVIVDDIVQRLQTHFNMFEPVCVLSLLAGVHVRGGDLHERV